MVLLHHLLQQVEALRREVGPRQGRRRAPLSKHISLSESKHLSTMEDQVPPSPHGEESKPTISCSVLILRPFSFSTFVLNGVAHDNVLLFWR